MIGTTMGTPRNEVIRTLRLRSRLSTNTSASVTTMTAMGLSTAITRGMVARPWRRRAAQFIIVPMAYVATAVIARIQPSSGGTFLFWIAMMTGLVIEMLPR